MDSGAASPSMNDPQTAKPKQEKWEDAADTLAYAACDWPMGSHIYLLLLLLM